MPRLAQDEHGKYPLGRQCFVFDNDNYRDHLATVQRHSGDGLKERFDISTCTVQSNAAEPGEDNRTAKCHILSNDTFGDHLKAKRNVSPAWRALKDMWKALGLPTTTTTATTSKFLCSWWRCFHVEYKVSLEYLQKI